MKIDSVVFDRLEGIYNNDTLQLKLIFYAYFVALYESFSQELTRRVQYFFCLETAHLNEEQEVCFDKTTAYKAHVKGRGQEENRNRTNELLAAIKWFQEMGAITEDERQRFLEIRKKRNNYVHKMPANIFKDLLLTDFELLVDLLNLYAKIDHWWIAEIETPPELESLNDVDKADLKSGNLSFFCDMFKILFLNKGDEYEEILVKLKEKYATRGEI